MHHAWHRCFTPSLAALAAQVRGALEGAGLKAGAVCLRYEKEHQAGALTHPDEAARRRAVELTKEGARWAEKLGAGELAPHAEATNSCFTRF